MANQYAIVIPFYKTERDPITEASLKSLIRNHSKWTHNNVNVVFVYPEGENQYLDKWIETFECDWSKYNIEHRTFNRNYFQNPHTYSKLLKSFSFWNSLSQYKKICIFQDDGFLIKDSFKELFESEWNYIGAPIMPTQNGWMNAPVVGNGGISIRDVKTFKWLTDNDGSFLKRNKEIMTTFKSKIENGYELYEDLYFGELCNYIYKIKKCPTEYAAKYIWDMNPNLVSAKYGIEIPSMLHAFDKNIQYYIQQLREIPGLTDNKELIDFCNEKYKEFFKYYTF